MSQKSSESGNFHSDNEEAECHLSYTHKHKKHKCQRKSIDGGRWRESGKVEG